ncbi:Octanoyltransferase [subsurface metagenome]
MSGRKMLCTVYQLGQIGYSEAHQLQVELLYQRASGKIKDTLLLLEHPPTLTIGKSGKLENILASQAELAGRGIPVFFVDRGGDVTYHGPGQLVGYPIIDLRDRGRDLHQYVRDLEEVIIRTLNDFGIKASRDKAHRGAWVGDEEIAAIGLRVRKWVTMHGFALNVNTNLEPFSLINPCGFSDRGATSISALLSQGIPMATVTERLLARFAEVFNARIERGTDTLARNHTYESKTAILV